MTTDENNKAAFLQALLTSPGERQQVEYKSAVSFGENTDFGLKLVKHILGMANTGGGWIVIGYEDGTLQPDPSHSAEIAATYDTTRISQVVNSCVERGQSLRLSIDLPRHPGTHLPHPIIRVEGFERTPFICRSTKSASDTGEQILQSGKVYIRRPGAATSEVRTQSDWDDLLKRSASQRNDELRRQIADLFPQTNLGNATPPEDPKVTLNKWIREPRDASGVQEFLGDGLVYMESAQMLVRQPDREWTHQELRRAATSEIWLYLDDLITPTQEGIAIRLKPPIYKEYGYLDKRGSCYSARLLQENYESLGSQSSHVHPAKILWVDVTIHRIAFELWKGAALYRELGVPLDEPYILSIKHEGLNGRARYAKDADYIDYRFQYSHRISREDFHLWQGEVTQDRVRSQLIGLTHQIASKLFALFGFTEVPIGIVRGVLSKSRNDRGDYLLAASGQLYWVYSDMPTSKSTIHKQNCRWFQNRSSTLKPDNWWHGPYESVEASESSRENVGIVSACSHCHP